MSSKISFSVEDYSKVSVIHKTQVENDIWNQIKAS